MAKVKQIFTDKKGEFDVCYLTRGDIAVTKCLCDKCGGTISVGSSYNWITFKCKCRVIMFYGYKISEGNGDVIPLSKKDGI